MYPVEIVCGPCQVASVHAYPLPDVALSHYRDYVVGTTEPLNVVMSPPPSVSVVFLRKNQWCVRGGTFN